MSPPPNTLVAGASGVLPDTGLGAVVHEFVSPAGGVTLPVLDNWEANCTAPGGFGAASGDTSLAIYNKAREVFTLGTVWRTRSTITGKIVWAGLLKDPAINGGRVMLTSKGWADLADRNAGRLLAQNRYYGEWKDGQGDPFNRSGNDAMSVDASGGRLRYFVAKGSELQTNDVCRLVFWAPNIPITRIAFHIAVNRSAPSYFFDIRQAMGPDGVIAATPSSQIFNLATPLAIPNPDITLHGDYDMILLTLHYAGADTPAGGTGQDLVVTITNLRVNAEAEGDELASSELVKTMCQRAGVGTAGVIAGGQDVLPFDSTASVAENLSLVSIYDDRRWMFLDYGAGPDCDFAPWDRRRWSAQPEDKITLDPLDRYNRLHLVYTHRGGVESETYVMAAPNPFPSGVITTYTGLSIQDALGSADRAESFGRPIINYLATRRYAGTASLATVKDAYGNRVSAMEIYPGDLLYVPSNDVWLRMKEVRYKATGVEVAFDDSLAVLDRFLIQRHRRIALRGQIAS